MMSSTSCMYGGGSFKSPKRWYWARYQTPCARRGRLTAPSREKTIWLPS
jgi:hypothetical protein